MSQTWKSADATQMSTSRFVAVEIKIDSNGQQMNDEPIADMRRYEWYR